MVAELRMTVPMLRVLAALLDEPETARYGVELMAATGLASGSLYPILNRLRTAGWAEAEWEDVDPAAAGRPTRRYYRLTPAGVRRASKEIATLHRQTSAPSAKARPAW